MSAPTHWKHCTNCGKPLETTGLNKTVPPKWEWDEDIPAWYTVCPWCTTMLHWFGEAPGETEPEAEEPRQGRRKASNWGPYSGDPDQRSFEQVFEEWHRDFMEQYMRNCQLLLEATTFGGDNT